MAATAIGLDIGTSNIKVVELRWRGQKLQLLSGASVQTQIEVLDNGELADVEQVGRVLGELFRMVGLRKRPLIVGITAENVIIRRLRMPVMPEEELREALRWEAKKFVPFNVNDINDVVVDYIPIMDVDTGFVKTHQELFVVAVARKCIESYVSALSHTGLNPDVIDVSVLAPPQALPRVATTCYMDIGRGCTGIVIVSDFGVQVVRTLPWGSERFTRLLAQSLDMSLSGAEEYKRDKLELLEESGEDSSSLRSIEGLNELLYELSDEILQTVKYYRSRRHEDVSSTDVKEIILSGGGSQIKGLSSWLARSLSIPVTLGDPFVDIEIPDSTDFREELFYSAPIYTCAVGLAKRGLDLTTKRGRYS